MPRRLRARCHGESYANLGDAMLGVVLREPIGVVSIITPWNFPFLIVSQKLPFALAAGCTAVVKPSEMTSASTFVLGDILLEAGVPAGVVNVLAGLGADVGAPMVSHPLVEMISFTGSTRVGKLTMATAAQTPEEGLDGTRRQERPDRLSRRRSRRPRPTLPCSAASSMPANAAMPAAGSSCTRTSPTTFSAR